MASGISCVRYMFLFNDPSRLPLQHQGIRPVHTPSCPNRAAAGSSEGAVARPLIEKKRVYLSDVPEEARRLIWEMQVQALAPLVAAGKLGCMLFQFPHWFTARRDNVDYLQRLRERTPWAIAVEFRGGGWMTDNYRARTLSLLEKLGMAYVVVDEPQGFRSSTPPIVASTGPLAVSGSRGTMPRHTKSRISALPSDSATCTRKRS